MAKNIIHDQWNKSLSTTNGESADHLPFDKHGKLPGLEDYHQQRLVYLQSSTLWLERLKRCHQIENTINPSYQIPRLGPGLIFGLGLCQKTPSPSSTRSACVSSPGILDSTSPGAWTGSEGNKDRPAHVQKPPLLRSTSPVTWSISRSLVKLTLSHKDCGRRTARSL